MDPNSKADNCNMEISDVFSGLFREIYLTVELIDKDKATIAKDLIGNKIENVKQKCFQAVDKWFGKIQNGKVSGQTDNPK